MSRIAEYIRAQDPQEAVGLKESLGEAAAYLAGGTDLVVFKPQAVTTVIDIGRLGLEHVEVANGRLAIGATARLRDIERHPAIESLAGGAMVEALRETGPWLIRNQATLAGNVCNASPAADSVPMLLALDAEVVLSDGRVVPLPDFFEAPHQTVLRNEMVAEIRLYPRDRTGSYHKHSRSKSDIALVDVAVAARVEGGRLEDVRVALASVAPTPMRAYRTERLLEGQSVDAELLALTERTVREEVRPISDWRTTAEYRRHAAGVLTRRAIARLHGG